MCSGWLWPLPLLNFVIAGIPMCVGERQDRPDGDACVCLATTKGEGLVLKGLLPFVDPPTTPRRLKHTQSYTVGSHC